ncbi:unnamed protein product [marine sediment metagenome]|uniref:Uncharacterized protein n=1 Tax=marine sediment metagenome TaxID=412755 RepID=X1G2M4_9ZZZZ
MKAKKRKVRGLMKMTFRNRIYYWFGEFAGLTDAKNAGKALMREGYKIRIRPRLPRFLGMCAIYTRPQYKSR